MIGDGGAGARGGERRGRGRGRGQGQGQEQGRGRGRGAGDRARRHPTRHAAHTPNDTRAGDVRGRAGRTQAQRQRAGGGRVLVVAGVVLRAGGGAARGRRGAGLRAVQPRLLELDAPRLLRGGPVRAPRGAPPRGGPRPARAPLPDGGVGGRAARGLARAGEQRAGAGLLQPPGRARPALQRGPRRHAPRPPEDTRHCRRTLLTGPSRRAGHHSPSLITLQWSNLTSRLAFNWLPCYLSRGEVKAFFFNFC